MRLSPRLAILAIGLLAGCARIVPPPAPPPPAPRPVPLPPSPSPYVGDWRDWPLSAGTWSYARESGATFGGGELSLRCVSGAVSLVRRGAAGPLTVRTTSLTRSVPAPTLPATDGLLDAMAYSRGRFVVEAAGTPVLVVPAWSEVSRVVEDCR